MVEKIRLHGINRVNCYVIRDGEQCFIIDPGFQKERIIEYVEEQGLTVRGILLTHGHIDHVTAIHCFHVPVYIHEADLQIIQQAHDCSFSKFEIPKEYDLDTIDLLPVTEGDALELGNKQIGIIHTPGHTPGGVCFRDGNDLYTGDTLFYHTVGKWIYPGGSQEEMRSSILRLLDTLDPEVAVHPAHGRPTTIGEEREHNFFYESWQSRDMLLPDDIHDSLKTKG